MLHVMLILTFAVLVIRDQGVEPIFGELPGWAVLVGTLGPMLAAALFVHLMAGRAMRGLTNGHVRGVLAADRAHQAARLVVLAAHSAGVLGLGWVDAIQRWLGGDLILIDDALAVAPLLLSLVAFWWSLQPIDRRMREAILIRELDEGRTIHPPPTRWRAVMLNVRHQLLIALVPLALLRGWSELVSWSAERIVKRSGRDWLGLTEPEWIHRAARWLTDKNTGPLVLGGVQLAGALLVFSMIPILLKLTWDTVPLGAGPTRDRLEAMCRGAGVYVRQLLVWRTSGTMINGAVLGVVRPWRYILLTDALLEQLSERQVEAVMAHEIGHVRKAHLPWMLAGLLAVSGFVAVLVDVGFRLAAVRMTAGQAHDVELGASLVAIAVALWALGFISRRFEWQADAFAAVRMSLQDPQANGLVTPEGAGSMQAALRAVAYLNHIPVNKFGFRHGSIATRLVKLQSTIGLPADRLPIDRTVRRLKWGLTLLLLVNFAAIIHSAMR